MAVNYFWKNFFIDVWQRPKHASAFDRINFDSSFDYYQN